MEKLVNGGHWDTWISNPENGEEILKDLCALGTAQNSKDLNEDEGKGIFKIDSKHQIRIEHGQIDDQLNDQINRKLAEICGPNVSKELLEELPKYITGIINENKKAISGYFEHVKIVYYEKNKPIHTVDLKTILAKGMQKVDKLMPQLSKAFKQLRQILKSIGDVDGSLKQMVTNLTTKKGPLMPIEMLEICAALWEDNHSNHNGKSETQQTNDSHSQLQLHEKNFFNNHPFVAPTIMAYGRRRKRAVGVSISIGKQFLIFGSLFFGAVLMPRIFSRGTIDSISSPSSEAVTSAMSSSSGIFGRLFGAGNGIVLIVAIYAGITLYAVHGHRLFPQHGNQQQQQQEGEGGNRQGGGGPAYWIGGQQPPPAN